MNNPEDLKSLRDYSKLTYEELRKKIGNAFAIDPVRPGKGKSEFKIQLNSDWFTGNTHILDSDKTIILTTHIKDVEIYSNIESRMLIMFIPQPYNEIILSEKAFEAVRKAYEEHNRQ